MSPPECRASTGRVWRSLQPRGVHMRGWRPADSNEELVDPSFVAAAHASAPVAPPVDPALVAVASPIDGTLVAAAPVAAAPVAPPVEEAPVVQAPVHVKAAPVAAPVDRASKKRNKVGGAVVEEKAAVAGIGTPYPSLC